MEGSGFMTYTAAGHQGAIEMFWLHFLGVVAHVVHLYILSVVCKLYKTQKKHASVFICR